MTLTLLHSGQNHLKYCYIQVKITLNIVKFTWNGHTYHYIQVPMTMNIKLKKLKKADLEMKTYIVLFH